MARIPRTFGWPSGRPDSENPFHLGILDGLAQPAELTSGITWTDPDYDHFNDWYDRGVNVGQNLFNLLAFGGKVDTHRRVIEL